MWIVGSQPRIAIRQAATTIEFPPQTSQSASDHSLDRQPTAPMNSWINVLDRAGRLERKSLRMPSREGNRRAVNAHRYTWKWDLG